MKTLALILTLIITVQLSSFAKDVKLDLKTGKMVANFIGEVLILSGQAVRIGSDNKQVALKKGDKIYNGNIVATGPNTFSKIRIMADGSIFTLGPKTTFKFTKYGTETSKKRRSIYQFIKGKMRANFPTKAKPGEVVVKLNKNASMGIRGTKIVANIYNNNSKQEVVHAALLTGKVNLTSHKSNKKFNLSPGQHYLSIGEFGKPHFKEEIADLKTRVLERLRSPDAFLDIVKEEEIRADRIEAKKENRVHKDDSPNDNKRSWRDELKKLNNRLQEK